MEEAWTEPRAADDFATISARMEALRREREGAQAAEDSREESLWADVTSVAMAA
jgi:hypothetical protein